jgi:hypothetical protein
VARIEAPMMVLAVLFGRMDEKNESEVSLMLDISSWTRANIWVPGESHTGDIPTYTEVETSGCARARRMRVIDRICDNLRSRGPTNVKDQIRAS